MINHNFFDGSEESDWLAGFLAADGSVSRKMDYWNISQSGDHGLEIVKMVRDLIGSESRIVTRPTTHTDAHSLHVTSAQMCRDLVNIYDVRPAKTYDYRGPFNTARMSKPFIRGYIDGDGCIGRYKVGASDDMLHISFVGTPEFLDRLHDNLPVVPREREVKSARNLREFRWNGSNAFDFGNWLYVNTHLPNTKKASQFYKYVDDAASSPPEWLSNRPKTDEVVRWFKLGYSRAEAGRLSGAGHNAYKIIRNYLKEQDNAPELFAGPR